MRRPYPPTGFPPMPFTEPDPAPGVLLIAQPMVHGQTFRRTVLLLCEHGPDGSFGLILNRPLDLALGDVLGGFAGRTDPLSLGGPVHPDTLHFLHRYGEHIPDAVEVFGDVGWGGDFESVQTLLNAAGTDSAIRFFMGYAGWSPGQLDDEIEEGAWICSPPLPDDVFPDDPDRLWRTTLRRLGGKYAILANFPDDPRMN